jgi:hypothetical protein
LENSLCWPVNLQPFKMWTKIKVVLTLIRYADDSFTSAFVSTVGIDFKVKTVFRQDKRVKLQIWVRSFSANRFSYNVSLNQFCQTFNLLKIFRKPILSNFLSNKFCQIFQWITFCSNFYWINFLKLFYRATFVWFFKFNAFESLRLEL